MISPLFNDPQYQSLRAMLDVSMPVRNAFASNVANINTPLQALRRQCHLSVGTSTRRPDRDVTKLQTLVPKIEVDDKTPSVFRLDGNNVNLEREMVELTKSNANTKFPPLC